LLKQNQISVGSFHCADLGKPVRWVIKRFLISTGSI